MATVYQADVKFVSAFVAYSEKQIQEILKEFLSHYRDAETGLGFESITVEVKRKA